MAQHDYSLANQSGASFRADLNNALAAIATQNSGATAPASTYAYQWWADTTTGLLKLRNAANSAWITVGTLATTNLGLATLAAPTFTGEVVFNSTSSIQLPSGTTAQRPGTPTNGDIRYNSTLSRFEGYVAGAWGAIGGGATGGGSDQVFQENGQTVTTNYTLSTDSNAVSAGPITINSGVVVTVPSGASWVIV